MRMKYFKWIGPVSDRNIYFYKLKSRSDIIINKLSDAKKYNVGTVINTANSEYLESKGFKLKKVPNYIQNMYKLLNGRVDLIDSLDYTVAYLAKKEGMD